MKDEQKGHTPMTDAELLRELRTDIRDMRLELKENALANNTEHKELFAKIACVDKVGGINAVKLGGFTAVIAIFFSGLVGFGFNVFAR